MSTHTVNDRHIRALVDSAKQAASNGRAQEAEQFLRQAERLAPAHPQVLNETARTILLADPARACGILENLVKVEPSNPEFWFNYAAALRRISRLDDALTALEKVLSLDSRNVTALLEKASLEELQAKPRAAAATYRTALQMLPPGFKEPPWMQAPLQRARAAVEENNRALETFVEQGLAQLREQHRDGPLRRFDQCVATLLQKRRIHRQQPTFMYYPELPTIEFYPREDFPWLDALEDAADDIRAELLAVLEVGGSTALDPYVADQPELSMDVWKDLNNSRRWGVYALWREGIEYPEHMARCPRTGAALKDWPRWDVPGSGPTALFSILDAKTHIPTHTGPVNTRLVVHLPLIVPPGCRFRVGGQTREWDPGKAFVFDDSINHEAWNDGDVPRAVMIVDMWSPFLSLAERELVRALTARVGEYYGSIPGQSGV